MDGSPLTHTNGYVSSGTGLVTLTVSDTSAGVGEDAPVAAFGVMQERHIIVIKDSGLHGTRCR